MKISARQLKQIIKEELYRVLNEEEDDVLSMLAAQGVEAASDEEAAWYDKCVAAGGSSRQCLEQFASRGEDWASKKASALAAAARARAKLDDPSGPAGMPAAVGAEPPPREEPAAGEPDISADPGEFARTPGREMTKKEALRLMARIIKKKFGLTQPRIAKKMIALAKKELQTGQAPKTFTTGGEHVEFPKIKLID